MREYQRIHWSRDGRVLTLSLNHPRKLNAVDQLMHEELAQVFTDAGDDKDSDVIVLTGAGAAFCAGGDISWFQRANRAEPGATRPSVLEAKKIVFSLLDLEKPIIAKVRGPAIGLGCTIALFCDVIFAADTARFADPHVGVGIVAGDGGAAIWPHLVGHARAKEYLMTGDAILAPEAERIGLINHAVGEGELDARVAAFAARLAEGPTQAIKYTKVSVNIGLKQIAHAILDASLAYEMMTFETDDHREAVEAFLAKRKPKFTGR